MRKVLLLGNSDVVIYNFRLELVEKLIENGHEVIISAPYGERIDKLVEMGCEFHDIHISRHGMNPYEEILLLREYKILMKKVKPDIVLSYTIKPNIYGAIACKSLNIPCIANITGLGTALENKSLVQFIIIMMYKYAFSKIRKVYFQNTENMQFFIDRKIAVGKHDLLPGSGVNLNRFVPMEYPEEDKIEFAFIARIMKEKGIDQYLDAAKYIHSKYPNTVFHVCGFCEQDYEETLADLHAKGIIAYHGMVRDIRTVLKNIHCTIHPTYYPEGISNVLLESCASARPIITTDRSGCREVIDDRVNGFICRQKDSKDLIEKIEKFISLTYEEKKKMGENGRLKVEKEFDRQIVVEKYLSDIENLWTDIKN